MGRATALALAAAGARIVVHYGRNVTKPRPWSIRSARRRTRRCGRRRSRTPGGLTRSLRKFATSSATGFDILVSNAGISKASPLEDITVKDFDELFAVNVRAPYFLVQQLLPILGDGSNIVFLSSLGARAAVGTLAAYASTKGAINTLVKYFLRGARPALHPRQTPSRPA